VHILSEDHLDGLLGSDLDQEQQTRHYNEALNSLDFWNLFSEHWKQLRKNKNYYPTFRQKLLQHSTPTPQDPDFDLPSNNHIGNRQDSEISRLRNQQEDKLREEAAHRKLLEDQKKAEELRRLEEDRLRLEKEKQDKDRIERERQEREKLAREQQLRDEQEARAAQALLLEKKRKEEEAARLEQQRLREQRQREQEEEDRRQKQLALEKEQREKDRKARELAEQERMNKHK